MIHHFSVRFIYYILVTYTMLGWVHYTNCGLLVDFIGWNTRRKNGNGRTHAEQDENSEHGNATGMARA